MVMQSCKINRSEYIHTDVTFGPSLSRDFGLLESCSTLPHFGKTSSFADRSLTLVIAPCPKLFSGPSN